MIYLIVGNTGAGKSTYALGLKKKSKSLIFTIDQWNKILFMPDKKDTDGVDWFLTRLARAESLMKELILQLEDQGIDSILDLGFSKIAHRKDFIDFASKHSIRYQIHYLEISTETRWQRVNKRNHEKGETFQFEVTKENFDFMQNWFEPLTMEEKEKAIIIHQ